MADGSPSRANLVKGFLDRDRPDWMSDEEWADEQRYSAAADAARRNRPPRIPEPERPLRDWDPMRELYAGDGYADDATYGGATWAGGESYGENKDAAHGALDVLGSAPAAGGLADGLNIALYSLEGDYGAAGEVALGIGLGAAGDLKNAGRLFGGPGGVPNIPNPPGGGGLPTHIGRGLLDDIAGAAKGGIDDAAGAVENQRTLLDNLPPHPKKPTQADPFCPDPRARGPHTVIGTRTDPKQSPEPYRQGITFDRNGQPVYRTDVTNHGRGDHAIPHFHPFDPSIRNPFDPSRPGNFGPHQPNPPDTPL